MAIDKLISFHIERQFPAIYREEGQELVQFVKEYYKFLETNDKQSLYNGRRIYEYRDIDTTLQRMLLFFKNKYLADLPFDEETIRIAVKNILGLYRRKGTKEGLDLFFTLFYQESIKVYNPSKDMLKPSDSRWSTGRYLQMFPNEGIFTGILGNDYTYADLIGKTITGSFSKAEAIVDKVNIITLSKAFIPIIYINDIRGNFVKYDKLQVQINDNEAVEFGSVYGSLIEVTIDETQRQTSGHKLGDPVNIVTDVGIDASGIVSEVSTQFTGQVNYDILDGGWGYSVESTKLLTSSQTLIAPNPDLLFRPLENLIDDTGNTAILIGQNDISFGIKTDGSDYNINSVITATDRQDTSAFGFETIKIVHTDNTTVYSFPEAVLRAATSVSPESTLFNIDIGGGRKLGDINNSGSVTSADALSLVKYIAGEETDANNIFFIENSFIPFVSANTSYDNYAAHVVRFSVITEKNDSSPGPLYPDTLNNDDVKVGELLNTEQISVIRDEVSNFLNVPLSANNYNDIPPALLAMTGTANTVNANTALVDAFDLEPFNIGEIKRFININPGDEYTNDTFAVAVDNSIRALKRKNQILGFPEADFSFKFEIGQEISQDLGGGSFIEGKIVGLDENKFTLTVRPYSYAKNFIPGVVNYKGDTFTVTTTEIDFDSPRVSGFNANIFAETDFATGRIKAVRVVNSGFGHIDGSEADIVTNDGEVAAKGFITVDGAGSTGGFWSSFNSHLNGDTSNGYFDSGKRIQDSDYYQEYSYEIQSKLGLEVYEESLKEIVHVAGTKVHGKFNFEDIITAPVAAGDFAIDYYFDDLSVTANTANTANTGGGSSPGLFFISVDTNAYSVDLTSVTVDSR